jgi:hypothetical protein
VLYVSRDWRRRPKKIARSNAIAALWAIAKELKIPLDKKITELRHTPYTISFVIRKRQQIDGFNELPKEKRPSDWMMWNSSIEEIESWLDKVLSGKKKTKAEFLIKESEIED